MGLPSECALDIAAGTAVIGFSLDLCSGSIMLVNNRFVDVHHESRIKTWQ